MTKQANGIRSIFVYPWDLIDAGVEKSLEDVRRMGFNHISLAVAYHSGKFLLPHNPKKTVYYHPSGLVYFTPRTEHYGLLRPLPADACGESPKQERAKATKDSLQAITEAARNKGLQVRAWIVGTHNSRLGRRHPEHAITNLNGEVYYHGLCPSHAETKHYLLQVVRDLLDQYDLAALDLESFDFTGMLHGDHHEIVGIPHAEVAERILGLCFCSACTRKARDNGIDADELKTQLRQLLEQLFRLEDSERLLGTLAGLSLYTDYLAMRQRIVEDIVAGVRNEVDERGGSVALHSTYWIYGGADPSLYGTSAERLSQYLDGWIVCYPRSPDEVGRFVERARWDMPSNMHLSGGVRALYPELSEPSDVGKYFSAYADSGICDYHVYNYGLASQAVLEQISACMSKTSGE